MRPVYFSAILSPCYGLSSCNYILIPRAAQLSLPLSPASRCPSLVTVSSQTFPLFPSFLVLGRIVRLVPLAIIFLSCSPSLGRLIPGARASRSLLWMLIHPPLQVFRLVSTAWIMVVYPLGHFSFSPTVGTTTVLLPPADTRPICFALQIELQFNVNRKPPPRTPSTETRFTFLLFHRPLHWLPLRHPYLITG